MIKVSVMYPSGDDATFDMDYYKTKHMEIVDRTIKPARWDVESGIRRSVHCGGQLVLRVDGRLCKLAWQVQGEALADIPNFTNAESAVQVSQIARPLKSDRFERPPCP